MSVLSPRKTGWLINRNFALLWGGSIISRIGDALFETTLVLWVAITLAHNQPWAPLAVSGVLAVELLPIFTIAPVAGVLVDRWKEKRRVMLRMDLARAGLVGLLLIIVLLVSRMHSSSMPFWQLGFLYVFVLVIGICTQFFIQASNVIYYDILEEADRARGAGFLQTIASMAAIIGPPLATLLFFTIGVYGALLFNALSFLVSFSCVLAIRLPAVAIEAETEAVNQQGFFQQLHAGLRFLLSKGLLRTFLIIAMLTYLWDSAFTTLGIFFLGQNLHAPTNLYGFLGTAVGIGVAAGALLMGLLAHRLGETRVFCGSVVAMGLFALIYARLNTFLPALIVVFLIGFSDAAINVALYPLILHITPRKFIGRVASVIGSIVTSTRICSAALIGWLVSSPLHDFHAQFLGLRFGSLDTVFVCTGLLILAGGIYAWSQVRGMTLGADKEENEMSKAE